MILSFQVLGDWLCWDLTGNAQLSFSFLGTQWCLLLWTEMLKKGGCETWKFPCFWLPGSFLWPFSKHRLGFTAGVWLLLSLSPWPPLEGIDGWFWQELFYFVLGNTVISAVCWSVWVWVLELHWYILRQLRMILCSSPKVLAQKKMLWKCKFCLRTDFPLLFSLNSGWGGKNVAFN